MTVSVTREGALAHVVIDNPPVNAISLAVREGLLAAVAEIEADEAIAAVVLSCAGRTFVAGADVTEFDAPPQAPHLPDVISAIERARVPWVAALHGTVLGGGLELAMGCRARVAAPGTKLGLPEVTLGVIPGAGGTLRLPRLVGAERALEMIAGGKPVSAEAAREMGLIDEIADGALTEAAGAFAAGALAAVRDRPLPPHDTAAFAAQKDRILAKARGQVSVGEAIAAVERGLAQPWDRAAADERAAFLRLRSGEEAAALRHIFFAERKTLRDPRAKGAARVMEHVGVIGGGTMGAGIAAACLMRGFRVSLVEQTVERAEAARETIGKTLAASAKRGVIADPEAMLAQLVTAETYSALAEADLVIEAVFEDFDVKTSVFTQIERVAKPEAIIATNTSYLDINAMAAVLADPSRVIGLHFFSPAHIMKLLEIVLPDGVADDVVATAAQFSKRLGKIGVLCGVCDGFIGNRIMAAYRQEADFLLEEGAEPEQVDRAMRDYGFPIGIFEMQDMAGLDIAWAMRKRRASTLAPDARYVRIADRLCEAGRLGRKTGAGWYDYGPEGATSSDLVAGIIAEERAASGRAQRVFDAEEIMARILGRLRAEAALVLSEGIARDRADIDVVMTSGYGYPSWRPCTLAPDTD